MWEWCSDWYNAKQGYRVLRGGAWGSVLHGDLLSSYRISLTINYHGSSFGFRCVLVVAGGSPKSD